MQLSCFKRLFYMCYPWLAQQGAEAGKWHRLHFVQNETERREVIRQARGEGIKIEVGSLESLSNDLFTPAWCMHAVIINRLLIHCLSMQRCLRPQNVNNCLDYIKAPSAEHKLFSIGILFVSTFWAVALTSFHPTCLNSLCCWSLTLSAHYHLVSFCSKVDCLLFSDLKLNLTLNNFYFLHLRKLW